MLRTDIEKLRRLGLTEISSQGEQAIRLTAQCRVSMFERGRHERRVLLEEWKSGLEKKLHAFRSDVVPNSLSLTAQTVELVVPINEVQAVDSALSADDVRVDILIPKQVVQAAS